ncbi:hypothetical protein COLO4_10578 [Corchorus olitorius]|uniref:Uncharacterized protein n=1 Tax=Corchorus olitorius TaxID=93759 RepID=A0A1R3K869_9ROSI|nr:hypothetical protein COLO4_10578 [Corchorus olitorius]
MFTLVGVQGQMEAIRGVVLEACSPLIMELERLGVVFMEVGVDRCLQNRSQDHGQTVMAKRGEEAVYPKLKQHIGGNRNYGRGRESVEESSGGSPLVAEANRWVNNLTYSVSTPQFWAGTSGLVVGQDIPGIGLAILGSGHGNIGSSTTGIRDQAVASPNAEGNKLTHQVSKNVTAYSTDDSYDPSSPFVFGAGSKRSTGLSVHQVDTYGGNFKRSREAEMETEAHENARLKLNWCKTRHIAALQSGGITLQAESIPVISGESVSQPQHVPLADQQPNEDVELVAVVD